MSSSIWTRCAASSEPKPLRLSVLRVVEAQSRNGTRRLVESEAEHAVLEELLDRGKPKVPSEPAFASLHYLLFTPFRYPPLKNGSRFGTRYERGIFYAARALSTALAEVAYYRLVFLEGTVAELGSVSTDVTVFRAQVRARRAIDLTREPFAAYEASISSKTSYEASQALGGAMRGAGVQAFV